MSLLKKEVKCELTLKQIFVFKSERGKISKNAINSSPTKNTLTVANFIIEKKVSKAGDII